MLYQMDNRMKNLKKTLIVMKVIMICAVLFLLYCVISLFSIMSSMEKYTSEISGIVTDVDKKSDPRHGYYYKAYVTSEKAPDMKFESPSTKHKYEKGESVTIHYDPDDISDYYIEGTEPTGDYVSLILVLLFLLIVVSVRFTITGKQYRKLCSEQSGSPEQTSYRRW